MKKRTDTITQMITDFNLNDAGSDRSIKEVIADWEHDVNLPQDSIGGVAYETEEEMVQGLYNDFQSEWNEDNDRAETFLEDNCSIEIVKAIEDLYTYVEWEYGLSLIHI